MVHREPILPLSWLRSDRRINETCEMNCARTNSTVTHRRMMTTAILTGGYERTGLYIQQKISHNGNIKNTKMQTRARVGLVLEFVAVVQRVVQVVLQHWLQK